MLSTSLITISLVWGTVSFAYEGPTSWTLTDQVSEVLQKRIHTLLKHQEFLCKEELLCGSDELSRFYSRRGFQPAWSTNTGPLPEGKRILEAIHEADLEGLRPEDYHLASIEKLLAATQAATDQLDPETLAALDLMLTHAFLLYASHSSTGRVNPETIHSEWFIKGQKANFVEILETALEESQIEEALENLRPQNVRYDAMKPYLSHYQNIMKLGGWPKVPNGPLMHKGDRGTRVAALRSRLSHSGDLHESTESDLDLFNEALEQAVKKFQKRHGLGVDGLVGPETLAALNVSVEDRIRQMNLNMERWRWLPRDFGTRYVLVNVANFGLEVVQNDKVLLSMSGVVGKESRPTPVFTGRITYMELNPYWHIPPRIAKEDVLPKVLEDPKYLFKENIRVFKNWKAKAPEIDPESIDWSQIRTEHFPFRLRQDPGPSNALCRIKFMFPNKFDVYMHDTPAKQLFEKTKRSFSSGCIRIEKPIELAEYLLQGDQGWTRERIMSEINEGKNQIVRIPEPVDVHVFYLTAWVDKDGAMNFRDDIYGRDELLGKALEDRPTSH